LPVILARSFSAPPPERDRLSAFFAFQLCGDGEESTEQDGAIIVSQFDQSGLLNQSTEFDQMTGAFVSLHDPFSRVGAALAGFNAVRHCLGALDRPEC
jgi:hypothetical protein